MLGTVYAVETKSAGGACDATQNGAVPAQTAEPVGGSRVCVWPRWEFPAIGDAPTNADGTYVYSIRIGEVSYPLVAVEQLSEVSGQTYPPESDPAPVALVIDGTLTEAVPDGTFVELLPQSVETVAWVEVENGGEAVAARVNHSLIPLLPEGIRGSADEGEAVVLTQDATGSWEVTNIIGKPPVMDGGYLDPDTLPAPPPVEPVAPGSSPTPVLEALGIGAIRISWTPVENETPVQYEVYFGASTGNVGDQLPTALLEVTAASATSASVDPATGSALVEGTDYYASIRARSGDQFGPPGSLSSPAQIVTVDLSGLDELQGELDTLNDTTIPGLQSDITANESAIGTLNNTTIPALQSDLDDILPITETKVSDGAITTDKLAANSVVAGKIAAGEVTTVKLDAGAVTADKIGADAVTAGKIDAGAVTAGTIAADAVTANEIAADAVTAEQIQAGAVDADAIAAHSINAEHLSANAITAEAITGQSINAKLAVADELWVAHYETSEEGGVEPAADSNVISLSAANGFQMVNPDGDLVVSFPTSAYDVDGNVISAVFRGRVIADDITVLQGVTIQGAAAEGFKSHVSPGAELVVDSMVTDPDTKPEVSFAPLSLNWPGLSSSHTEMGWGTFNDYIVTGRHNANNLLQLRIIDPDTGLLVRDVDTTFFTDVAGVTAVGGYAYVMGRLTGGATDWSITKWSGLGSTSATNTGVSIGGLNSHGALSIDDDGNVVMASTSGDTFRIDAYSASTLSVVGSNPLTSVDLGGRTPTGFVGTLDLSDFTTVSYLAAGNRVFALKVSSTNHVWVEDTSKSFYTQVGKSTGFGTLADGRLAVTNQTGKLTVYNPTLNDGLVTRWTRYDSVTDRETGPSDARELAWPNYMYASISVDPAAPGTTGAYIYTKSPGGAEYRRGLPAGETVLADIESPVGGALVSPPATSEFIDPDDPANAAPALIASQAADTSGDPRWALHGNGVVSGEGVRPVGEITMYLGATAPDGWLVCDGGTFSSATYPKLYAHLGNSTTLPDLRSRFPVGAGTYTALKGTDGATEANRSPAHDHASGSLTTGAAVGTVNREPRTSGSDNAAGTGHTHNVTGRTGMNLGPNAGTDSQFPRYGVNFIIRAK